MEEFDFKQYERSAIASLLSGKPLVGSNRALDGALEAELVAHIGSEKSAEVSNRKSDQQSKQVEDLQGGNGSKAIKNQLKYDVTTEVFVGDLPEGVYIYQLTFHDKTSHYGKVAIQR